MDKYKATGLWRRAFGSSHTPSIEASTSLEAAYSVFRERASALTAQIARSLPSLTIHDVTHLDALWETADLIAGEGYPLNPAEAFVFGGAVLLHDAALCVEAYEGGQPGLRDTLEWKDAFAAFGPRGAAQSEQQRLDEADFAAMRLLHAEQAAELAQRQWLTPEGEPLYLIENHQLRKHYGQIIGRIAASHHWPIEDVASKLQGQINALANMPREWRVDPVKVACLLRCADAAHLDSRRAPDFLRALASLHGISAQHWTAQNWLERADSDAADPEQNSIIFTSGKAFDEDNAEAWWVAYDAIKLVDRELAASAELLERRPQSNVSPPFQMRRVTGAHSPAIASKSITTSGWSPQSVEIHVGNLERLISQLGGEKLYGEDQSLVIVIREIIQNARDSILARRSIDRSYVGGIRVILEEKSGVQILSVVDDGVGMSHRIATGPLLDFGSSFWVSDLVRNEFPGLLSKGYKSVGKFGIGFYSVFMVAAAVSVSSRRFDMGLDSVTQVRFPKGLSLRPLISRGAPPDFGFSNSTVVKLSLRSECGDPSSVLISKGRVGYDPEVRLSLTHCLSVLCAGLDVAVDLIDRDGVVHEVHRPLAELNTPGKRLGWLRKIAGLDEGSSQDVALLEHASRLTPINDGDRVVGMAALSTAVFQGARSPATISTVGGLASMISQSDFSRFVGAIDYEPSSAKRDPSSFPTGRQQSIDNWANEQKKLLPDQRSNALAWCHATCSLSDLKCDPIEVATFIIRREDQFIVLSLDEMVNLANFNGVAFYKSHIMDHIDVNHNLGAFSGMSTFWPVRNSNLLSLERDGNGQFINTSAMSCILRRAKERGIMLDLTRSPETPQAFFGPIEVLILKGRVPMDSITIEFAS